MLTTEMSGRLTTAEKVKTYMMAGKAKITVRSVATQTRFTFKITKLKDKSLWFVALLRGNDNTSDYTYMGIIKDGVFSLTQKSRVSASADSVKAMTWLQAKLVNNVLPESVEVWHEGTCGRCGKDLTVPESIERGIGPECAKKMF